MLKYWFKEKPDGIMDATSPKSGSVLAMSQEDDFVEVQFRELSFAEAAALPPNTTVVDEYQLGRTVTDGEMAAMWQLAKRHQ